MLLSDQTDVKDDDKTDQSLLHRLKIICDKSLTPFAPMSVAADIMTTQVKTLNMDNSVKACLKLMKDNKIRHAVVTDKPFEGDRTPHFVGIVSQRDVLRISARKPAKKTGGNIDPQAMKQLLSQIVVRTPLSAGPQTPIPEIIAVMIENHIDIVPVLENEKLLGIITTVDIIMLYVRLDHILQTLCSKGIKKANIDLTQLTAEQIQLLFLTVFQMVRDIMTTDVICLEPDDSLAKAMEVFRENSFRHAMVIDESGTVAGIVSDRDILRNLPFAGRRPPGPSKRSRDYLFKILPGTKVPNLTIADIMTTRLKHLRPDSSMRDAANRMRESKIECLPIIDEQKKLCGIVTITDLMRSLLDIYQA